MLAMQEKITGEERQEGTANPPLAGTTAFLDGQEIVDASTCNCRAKVFFPRGRVCSTHRRPLASGAAQQTGIPDTDTAPEITKAWAQSPRAFLFLVQLQEPCYIFGRLSKLHVRPIPQGGKSLQLMNNESLKTRVVEALAQEVGPALDMDGTLLEVLDVTDGVARIRLGGVCGNCPSSIMTVVMGIEEELRLRVPRSGLIEAVP